MTKTCQNCGVESKTYPELPGPYHAYLKGWFVFLEIGASATEYFCPDCGKALRDMGFQMKEAR